MLERLGFQQLVEETLTVKRVTRAMSMYQFILAMVLAAYVGFSRLYQLRFVAREPMVTGILKVLRLPPQCPFWRFLASLHVGIARQLLTVQRQMRERVWQAAHVGLRRSRWTRTRPCTRCLASRWEVARATTQRTKAKRATSLSSPFWERRENTSAESCTTETGPPARKSRDTCRVCSERCRRRWKRSSRARIQDSIVGMR